MTARPDRDRPARAAAWTGPWRLRTSAVALVAALALAAGWAAAQDGAPPTNPALGVGLSGVADWATEQPFLDLMRSSRPWIGHKPGGWGEWDNAALAAGGFLTGEGWPRGLPAGAERLEALVLTGQPEAGTSLAGTYVLRWTGTAEVSVNGRVADIRTGDHELRFAYTPGDGYVAVAVTAVDGADPIAGMTLVREDRLPLYDAGERFNPDFLARVGQFRALRFLDWMLANGSRQVAWADRPELDAATWAESGVPVEVMVELANEVGADPWFTLPHQADDAYVTAFATYVRDHLDPRLEAYAEWSNEVWNWGFGQSAWAQEQAAARWPSAPTDGDAWMQFAGLRASEVADIWGRVYGPEAADRLVRVVATQTGWPGLEVPLLEAPLAVAEGRPPPTQSFDAYAVSGYFYAALPEDRMVPDGADSPLRDWIAQGTAEVELTRLARASVEDLVTRLWPYHAEVARTHGLRLVAYEGGTHLVGQGDAVDVPEFTDVLTRYSYTPEMGELYRTLLKGWQEVGGTQFMHYSDIESPSRWGSWGALRHLDDDNPRWRALEAANAVEPDWDDRAPEVFADGRLVEGTQAGETLSGTPEEDVILAGEGDDVILVEGGDRVDGGAGFDRAMLPGLPTDWTASADGPFHLFTQGWITVRLRNVEEVGFTESEERSTLAEPG